MESTRYRRLMIVLVSFCLAGGVCGCLFGPDDKARMPYGVDAMASPLASSAAYRGTIGELTYFDGLIPLKVRGYGLVVGLGKNGSATCPDSVRTKLVQSLYKKHNFSSPVMGTAHISPEQLVDDIDTAVVLVEGEVPAGATEGNRFDVRVRALPGSSTKSLRGGRLYTTDLHIYQTVSVNMSISGRALAQAAGPLFLNPFSDDSSATRSNPLEASVVSGGMVVEGMRTRLVLVEPSYGKAKRIQDRINAQFPGGKRVADATSPSFININIPAEYENDVSHFLHLLRALYLSRDPAFGTARSRILSEEIIRPEAPHALICLCFESLGRTAIPDLNKLYAHRERHVSFYAAAAGLRLGDYIAVDAMAIHADDPHSEYRFQAIRALGLARGMANAAIALRRLLDNPDVRVKIAAYEALADRGDTSITSRKIAEDNFILDQVSSKGPAFVYAKRQDKRRIALFGQSPECIPPLFYRAPDGGVTINAEDNDEQLTLMRVSPQGTVSPPIPGPTDLAALIRLLGNDAEMVGDKVVGLGVDYAAIVRALYHLCEKDCINADFVLEQPNVLELFGPARPAGRAESEL